MGDDRQHRQLDERADDERHSDEWPVRKGSGGDCERYG